MSDEKTPITNLEIFDTFYDSMKTRILEMFEEDKRLDHILMVIKKDGYVDAVDFEKWTSIADQFTGDEDKSKAVIYHTFAEGMRAAGIIGFVEFFEAWTIHTPVEGDMSAEQAMERMTEIREKYGQIKDVPTRMEVVVMNGRFKDMAYMSQWKVGRRDSEVWLSPYGEHKEKSDAEQDGGRQGWLHKAVMENIRGEAV